MIKIFEFLFNNIAVLLRFMLTKNIEHLLQTFCGSVEFGRGRVSLFVVNFFPTYGSKLFEGRSVSRQRPDQLRTGGIMNPYEL